MQHTCSLVGKRQLLSFGGLTTPKYPNGYQEPDTIVNGLAIFDMTEMVWKEEYRADAEAYRSPMVIEDWYEQGGQQRLRWNNPKVKQLFLGGDRPASCKQSPRFKRTLLMLLIHTKRQTRPSLSVPQSVQLW